MSTDIIYGPPGTGKTTALLADIEKTLETIAPERIAFVTFTKEGAENGKRRAMEKFGFKAEDLPYFGTLHSMAFRANKMQRVNVIQKRHYYDFGKKVGMNFTGYYTEDLKSNDDLYLFFDEVYRNTPAAAEYYLKTLDTKKLDYVRKNYIRYKEQTGIYDYTDMIERFVNEQFEIPVHTAYIDESQDLTRLQWKMVWTAFRTAQRIVIAGDDDQAIYEWSGADVKYLLNIEGNAKVLNQSYRVPSAVFKYATNISEQIVNRHEKTYNSTEQEGEVRFINSLRELQFNENETWMLLSRNNYFLCEIRELLEQRGFNYLDRNTPAIKPQECTAIRLYLQAQKDGFVQGNILPQYLKKNYSLEEQWYDALSVNNPTYIRTYLAKHDGKLPEGLPNIRVSTIHGVKGGEADNVVLLTDMTRNTHNNLRANPDSEHRVFYVGVTRARKRLFVRYPASKLYYPLREE